MLVTTSHQAAARPIHVDALRESDIDTLLDKYLFNNEYWCYGYCELQRQYGANSTYRCSVCEAIDERGAAAKFFGDGMKHRRLAPHYSKDQIVEAMKLQAYSVYVCFGWHINHEVINAPTKLLLPSQVLQLLELSPRSMAIAALKALGVVDVDGYVVKVIN